MTRLIALLALLVLVAGPAAAHEYRQDHLDIQHPWARATSASATNGAVYLAIRNESQELERLVGAATPMAAEVQIHTHEEVDGVMQMRRIDAIEIEPGHSVTVAPGGLHLMLMGLTAPLQRGTLFPMTLMFEKAGAVEIEVYVEGPGAAEPEHGMTGHGDHHGAE